MKAVIPAAGFGTKFLPLTKAIPKEMLPVGEVPVIHHVVEEAVNAGFDDILIILSRGKEAISNYFSVHTELEHHLARTGKTRELAAVKAVTRLGRVSYTYQAEMRGLGDAINCAREFVGTTPMFAVLLGDTIMQGSSPLPGMLKVWQEQAVSSVALEPCVQERVQRYGIAGGKEVGPGIFSLTKVVEKPQPNLAPLLHKADGTVLPYHAFAARYLFSNGIFDDLAHTPPGYAGEVQVTDAMDALRARHGLFGVCWDGCRLDIGHPTGLLAAMQLYAKP